MRIAIVASDYAPTVGGVQTAVRNIAINARRRGHAVTVLSYKPSSDVAADEVLDDIPVHRFPWGRRPMLTLPFRALWTLFDIYLVLREFKPDIVYVHFISINALYVLLLHYLTPFRLVVSARGNDIQGIPLRSRGQRWMLARLFGCADAVLFCSSYLRQAAEPYLGYTKPGAYVGVVGDGFDADEFAGSGRFFHHNPYVLGMGRLVHKKGFDLLIQAFARLAPDFPWLDLLISGDGEERRNLEACIARTGVGNRVRLLGFPDRPTSIALFLGCEFFVLSSRIEPFGIVVVEAMSAHKAVLATRSGGVVDLVQDGVNGRLVEPTVDGLEAGMRELLNEPEVTSAMAARAAESIQKCTWGAVTDQFLDVFEHVLSKPA